MVVTTPFTLKGTRSMIQMQRLQPEMRRIQLKYKDDRQKQNEEMMAFYKENNLNPLGGCLPLLLQAPVFLILFRVVHGLTHLGADGQVRPEVPRQRLGPLPEPPRRDEDAVVRRRPGRERQQGPEVGFVHGLPHIVLVAIVAGTSYFQQKQIQGRNPNAEIPPQQKMLMRLMPAMFVVFAFISPSALVVYFVTSNVYRIGMQAYITRSLYHGEDSLGAQAQRAAVEAKKLRDEDGGPSLLPRLASGPRAQARLRQDQGRSHARRQAHDNGSRSRPPHLPRGQRHRTGPRRRRSAADGMGRDDRQDGRGSQGRRPRPARGG